MQPSAEAITLAGETADALVGSGTSACTPVHALAHELYAHLSKAHAMRILFTRVTHPGSLRFNELKEWLDLPATTLSRRLSEFASIGLVTRTSFDEIPPRVVYEATPAARALSTPLEMITRWAEDQLEATQPTVVS